jgi:hypothetical protein
MKSEQKATWQNNSNNRFTVKIAGSLIQTAKYILQWA